MCVTVVRQQRRWCQARYCNALFISELLQCVLRNAVLFKPVTVRNGLQRCKLRDSLLHASSHATGCLLHSMATTMLCYIMTRVITL
jgi:hypothetical protein